PEAETQPIPDLVQRDFTATRPNELWVADAPARGAVPVSLTHRPGVPAGFRPGPGSSTWLSCSMPGAARSSAGRWPPTCVHSSSWMPYRWPLNSVARRALFTPALGRCQGHSDHTYPRSEAE